MAKSKRTQLARETPRVLLPGRDPDELVLTFAGNIVKHLGVQMYAGRPVPAIAELISNAWDADATDVAVRMPLNEGWDSSDQNHSIEVSDDGNGMTWDMVRDAYLDVGRDRREVDHTDKSPGGRLLQGRKGVGKLAGFGIADIVEVQTVCKDPDPGVRKKTLIWFKLDLTDLKKAKRDPAPVNLIYAGPVQQAPTGGRRRNGTTVTLRRLHQRRALNADRFHQSMAQRFLLIGPKFRLRINGARLKEDKIKLQWRWPKKNWGTDNITGCGPITYWIGFTWEPRKQNEGDLSGILIYTRGKISQEATFFEISGGVHGQHGLRYLVGMIKAEWLDAGIEAPDLIATHRGSIAWESPQGMAFQEWGQRLLKKHLTEWAKLRTELRVKQIKDVRPEFMARIEQLAPSYKKVALRFVDKFKSVEMEPQEFEDILSWFLDALENATLRSILQKLRDTDITDLEQLDELLSKMEVRTAVTLLQVIDSNLAAIEALERMHHKDAKERGVISKHLESNPWLIDPTWMLNKAEARVSTWIWKEFGLKGKRRAGDADRADFFCVAVGGTLHIVEIKRGAFTAKAKDILQAEKYRKYVTKRFSELTDPKAIKYGSVQSHLIAAELHDDAESVKQSFADKGWVFFTTWDDLIERAKQSHRQFRDILEKRAADGTESSNLGDSVDNGESRSSGGRKKSARKKSVRKKRVRRKK
ncbi:MAG: ATP-binding protein [Planctomycetes bacterium]|nr:ATP-binding protein [Planctomycetota bacterium]